MTQHLTDHLNRVDETNSIKFTYEEESEGTIYFLDTILVRKDSGEVKLLIFRKNTHTDQYPHRPIPIQTNTHTDQYPYRPIPTQANTHTDQYPHRPIPIQTNTHTDQYPYRPIPTQTNTHTDQYPYRPIPIQTNTHTDQYPYRPIHKLSSHHPLHQKMGVIRTLLDRCEKLVTEEEDKQKEREHIKEALTRCGPWTISTVQRKLNKEGRQHREEDGGKRYGQRHGDTYIILCPRIIRKHITDHEEIQGEYCSEASQQHREVTGKTKRQSQTCNATCTEKTKRTLGTQRRR